MASMMRLASGIDTSVPSAISTVFPSRNRRRISRFRYPKTLKSAMLWAERSSITFIIRYITIAMMTAEAMIIV